MDFSGLWETRIPSDPIVVDRVVIRRQFIFTCWKLIELEYVCQDVGRLLAREAPRIVVRHPLVDVVPELVN